MPGSSTTPGRPGARDDASVRVAFRTRNSVCEHRVQSKLIAAGHRTRSLVCKNGVERLGGLVENPFLVALRERG